MRANLDELLSELERFGKANDGVNAERPRPMLNITRDTGDFLANADPRHLCAGRARDRRVQRLLDALARERRGRDRGVGDNATSHAAEVAPFVALVAADVSFITSLVPVGNGELLVVKAAKAWSDPT